MLKILIIVLDLLYNHTIAVLIGLILIVTVVYGLIYLNSLRSRKYYRCLQCKEEFRTEQMHSHCCHICGGKLEEITGDNV